MNTTQKIIIAILGACNKVVTVVTPILLALLIINSEILTEFQASALMIIAILSTIFRALKTWIE